MLSLFIIYCYLLFMFSNFFLINSKYFFQKVVMRQTNLPISLLNEKAKHARVHLLDTEPYHTVFGKKKTRKRPSLSVSYEWYDLATMRLTYHKRL
jgi:hypothetical protein